MKDPYVRAITVVSVTDGDTFACAVDLGFYVTVRMACRVAGINAPERTDPGGPEARTALAAILGAGPVTVQSVKADKYAGRFDAIVTVARDVLPGRPRATVQDVALWLVQQGHAVWWDGTGPKPSVPWPPPVAPHTSGSSVGGHPPPGG